MINEGDKGGVDEVGADLKQLGYVSGVSRGVKSSLNKCALYWDRVLNVCYR